MFNLNDGLRYWLYTRPADMRKGFHTLGGIVRDAIVRDPNDGGVYIFLNSRRNRIKLLHWESGGMVIYSKMLERGTFGTPSVTCGDGTGHPMEWRDLVLMVEGIIASPGSRRQRYEVSGNNRKTLRKKT